MSHINLKLTSVPCSKGRLRKFIAALCLLTAMLPMSICAVSSQASADEDPMNPGIDFPAFEAALTSNGVDGWIHGRLGNLAVFVFREKDSFFHYALFPLVSHIPAVASQLDTLHRHDKIHIKGQIIANGAPQKHIYVTELAVIERWDGGGGETVPPYDYEAKIPDELIGRSDFIGKVHFAAQDGSMIVCEYKDAIIPVVGIPGKAENLFRGDKVRIHYKIQPSPRAPTHLDLDNTVAEPVEVLEHLIDMHGKSGCVEGALVRFPKSPEVLFDVYALQRTDSDFVTLDFTLVNFDDANLFKAIRDKAEAAWNQHHDTVENGRNKLINHHLHTKACGTFNVVSPSQANPQVIINKLDDLTIEFL